MPELADVFSRYGPAYLEKYGPAMLPSHRRTMQDIVACRTESMGGQVFCCDHCGSTHYVYHSCRNRSCPKCHHEQTEAWLTERRQELLPIPYFHVVFTVPDELHACLRSGQTERYSLLIQAAARATIQLAADPHYVGGLVGVLSVLHTWGRTLTYHPHVHCLVTGGGLDRDTQQWRAARDHYLVPVKALSKMFRRIFQELVGPLRGELAIPPSVWRVPWVVYCEPVRGGMDNVLSYLARYVHRIAITNNRILAIDHGQVSFRYQDTRDQQWKIMTLEAEEFIRRFLQHVLPQGFHKVRYYGLWAPGNRSVLRRLQLWLAPPDDPGPPSSLPLDAASEAPDASESGRTCPTCGRGILRLVGRLHPRGRGPP